MYIRTGFTQSHFLANNDKFIPLLTHTQIHNIHTNICMHIL